jgi:hypothetical protein
MTDLEFEILDELYFVQSYEGILASTKLKETDIQKTLYSLLEKGWIKCCYPIEREIPFQPEKFEDSFRNYYYIATKAGLLAHNGKDT